MQRMLKMSTKRKTGKGSVAERAIAGLSAFLDAVNDETVLNERFTIRNVELDLQPQEYGPESVVFVRQKLGVSQAVLARILGTSLATVQAWEQGKREPSKMASRFLDEIAHNPEHWRERLREAAIEVPRESNGVTAACK